VAYVQSWKKHLKDDPRIIATAAQQAQKAANWILGNRNQNKED
jgi:antirestriction protein ArdC